MDDDVDGGRGVHHPVGPHRSPPLIVAVITRRADALGYETDSRSRSSGAVGIAFNMKSEAAAVMMMIAYAGGGAAFAVFVG